MNEINPQVSNGIYLKNNGEGKEEATEHYVCIHI